MNMMFEMHQNSQSFQSLLENKLNYIIDKMDNLSAHDVAARIQDQAEYHDDVVKAQFPELPYNSVQTLTTMNTSLADKDLAVSLVGCVIKQSLLFPLTFCIICRSVSYTTRTRVKQM